MVLKKTYSVCPVCLKRIPATRVGSNEEIFLYKTCQEHGEFNAIIWRGYIDYNQWISGITSQTHKQNDRCPSACGLCPDHLQATCCVLLEVINRCNLGCRFCFADSGNDQDPSFESLQTALAQLCNPGKTLVQLSGGEPTIRDDLCCIVEAARKAGCRYVQLNTNGIRLGESEDYVKALKDAGLSFVFMQFDGLGDGIYEQLRGRALTRIKQKAIEHCDRHRIGVTLVPTLVPGVNVDQIGDIIEFGVSQAPAVRGVHFQPVSYIGRTPEKPTDAMRLTLDQVVFEIGRQTKGLVPANTLLPSHCDHPLCGFHGDFVVTPEKKLVALSRPTGDPSCSCHDIASKAQRNREFVGRRWERPRCGENLSGCNDMQDMKYFLERVKTHGFTITGMAFQDAGTLDLERLQHCGLHVFDNGRFVPFCAFYLSGWES